MQINLSIPTLETSTDQKLPGKVELTVSDEGPGQWRFNHLSPTQARNAAKALNRAADHIEASTTFDREIEAILRPELEPRQTITNADRERLGIVKGGCVTEG